MPRRSENAAGQEAQTPANGTVVPPSDALEHFDANGSAATGLENGATESTTLALATVGPRIDPDPGLYAVLGLDPSVSDAEIRTTYRRQAARLLGGGSKDHAALRQLNVAYEVLGTPIRREEYDRLRVAQLLAPGAPSPIRPGAKAPARVTRRRRPRHAVQPHYAGFSYVVVVLIVVGLAVAAGALIILPRLSINLSALNALQSVLPLPNSSRRAADVNIAPAPTAAPTAAVRPGVAQRFVGTTVSVSDANPAQNSVENVLIKLRRDGQPAANSDVWAIVKYSTTDERWPTTGSLKTDATGAATITFNIGRAIPQHPVPVEVFAQVEDQQFSWSTTFTPR